jgi:hypothetical protein
MFVLCCSVLYCPVLCCPVLSFCRSNGPLVFLLHRESFPLILSYVVACKNEWMSPGVAVHAFIGLEENLTSLQHKIEPPSFVSIFLVCKFHFFTIKNLCHLTFLCSFKPLLAIWLLLSFLSYNNNIFIFATDFL